MLNRWWKIVNIAAGIAIIVAAIVAPGIIAIFWLAQLDSKISVLQHDVGQLKKDVRQLQDDMAQVKADIEKILEGQQIIIQILREMAGDAEATRIDLADYIHGADGRAEFSLDSR